MIGIQEVRRSVLPGEKLRNTPQGVTQYLSMGSGRVLLSRTYSLFHFTDSISGKIFILRRKVATMKRLIFLLIAIAGCASPQKTTKQEEITKQDEITKHDEIKKQEKTFTIAKQNLSSSLRNSKVTCNDKPTCEKAFSLTKIYIQNNSNMPFQYSDESLIYTYTPIKHGYIGITARRKPESDGRETVSITISCNGLYSELDDSSLKPICINKIADIYNGYKPFIEERLK